MDDNSFKEALGYIVWILAYEALIGEIIWLLSLGAYDLVILIVLVVLVSHAIAFIQARRKQKRRK